MSDEDTKPGRGPAASRHLPAEMRVAGGFHTAEEDEVPLSEDHSRFLRSVKRRRVMITIVQGALLVGLVLLWEVAAQRQWINSFITSSPSQIARTIYQMAGDGSLWRHASMTVGETVFGFTVGTLAGTLIAIALWWSPFLSRVLEPYIVVLNSVPKVALGPIFIVWLGNGIPAIIAMGLAISLIVTIMMVFTGFSEVDKNWIKLLRTFGATKWQVMTKVVLPASIPTVVAALKVNVGLSLVGAIVGEFLVSQAGLGFLIVYGGQVFKMSLIMASVVILCLVSAVLYYGVTWLENRLLRWRS